MAHGAAQAAQYSARDVTTSLSLSTLDELLRWLEVVYYTTAGGDSEAIIPILDCGDLYM